MSASGCPHKPLSRLETTTNQWKDRAKHISVTNGCFERECTKSIWRLKAQQSAGPDFQLNLFAQTGWISEGCDGAGLREHTLDLHWNWFQLIAIEQPATLCHFYSLQYYRFWPLHTTLLVVRGCVHKQHQTCWRLALLLISMWLAYYCCIWVKRMCLTVKAEVRRSPSSGAPLSEIAVCIFFGSKSQKKTKQNTCLNKWI